MRLCVAFGVPLHTQIASSLDELFQQTWNRKINHNFTEMSVATAR